MFTLVVRIFIALVMCFLPCQLQALSVEITNDFDDMVLSKKIWVRLSFDEKVRGVVKNSLQFSVDHMPMRLISWHPLPHAVKVFSESFKRTKALFTDSFTGWLSFSCDEKNIEKLKNDLSDVHLYLSCFIMSKKGTVQPWTAHVPLIKCFGIQHRVLNCAHTVQPVVPIAESHLLYETTHYNLGGGADMAKDFEPVEGLQRVWCLIVGWLKSGPVCTFFFWLFVFLAVLCIILVALRWRQSVQLYDELLRDITIFSGFAASNGFLLLLAYSLRNYVALYAAACMCVGAAVYALTTPPFEDQFWGRLKDLIGITLGIVVLPLIVQATLWRAGF